MSEGNDPSQVRLTSIGWRMECQDASLSFPAVVPEGITQGSVVPVRPGGGTPLQQGDSRIRGNDIEGGNDMTILPDSPGVNVFWSEFVRSRDPGRALTAQGGDPSPLNTDFMRGSFRSLRVTIWRQLVESRPDWKRRQDIIAKASLGSTPIDWARSGLEASFSETWDKEGIQVTHETGICHLKLTVRWEALSATDSKEILDLQRYGATIDNQDPSQLIRLLHRGIAFGSEEVARAALVVLQRLPVTPDRGRRFVLREAIWATQPLIRELEAQKRNPRFPDSADYRQAIAATLDHLLTDTDRDGRPNFADYRDVWGFRIDTSKLSRL